MTCRGCIILSILVLPALLFPGTWSSAQQAKDAVEFSFGETEPQADRSTKTIQVVATGVGITPEKAKEHAFSAAIEQAVGVLVDAETLVENDQIVRDRVLTYSKGFVEQFNPIASWEKDGLHYVRIKAGVATEKLVATLERNNVTVRSVAGELLFLHAMHELNSEEQAAEMLRKALRGCTMDKLVTIEIDGKPEVVQQDRAKAILRVKCRLQANLNNWRIVQGELKRLLDKVAAARGSLSTLQLTQKNLHPSGDPFWLWGYSPGEEPLNPEMGQQVIYLLKDHTPTWSRTYYDTYAVPTTIAGEAIGELCQRNHALEIRLLNADNAVVAESTDEVQISASFPGGQHTFMHPMGNAFCLAPLFWWMGNYYYPSCSWHKDLEIPIEQLRRVAKVEVELVADSSQ